MVVQELNQFYEQNVQTKQAASRRKVALELQVISELYFACGPGKAFHLLTFQTALV